MAWHNGNGIGHINSYATLSPDSTRTGDNQSTIRVFIQATQAHSGAVSTAMGFGHHWGRNGEFCVAVGPYD